MKTVEQIVYEVVTAWIDTGDLEERIAAAIRADREQCAQLCEEITAARATEMGLLHYDHLTGLRCAAAIRALP